MRRRVITRVTTSFRSCLAAKTSSGTASSIPFRYNRRSCHCLPVSVKSDALRLSRLNRFSNASPKPSSICACTSLSVSELLHKVNLYHSLCRRSMTSTASQPASKKSSGDFPVVRCTHVLSSSMSFPYGKIVTHFQWFVNGEFRYCITFSSACTSTATPSGTQWSSASFLLPCSPQKGSYRFRLSGILPSPSSTSSSLSGKVLLPESTELSQKPEIQLPAFYEFLPYILHTK